MVVLCICLDSGSFLWSTRVPGWPCCRPLSATSLVGVNLGTLLSDICNKNHKCHPNLSKKQSINITNQLHCALLVWKNCHVQYKIRLRLLMAWWKKTDYLLTSSWKQCEFVWLWCKHIHQMLLCCNSDWMTVAPRYVGSALTLSVITSNHIIHSEYSDCSCNLKLGWAFT